MYWVNASGNKVSFANLDGSGGGGDLNTTGATVNNPIGVAVDHLGGRIYWANYDGQKISFANLDGSGGADINTGSATVNFPAGVAVDRSAGRVYWANSSGAKISFANLDGSGGGDINIAGATPPGNAHGVAVDAGAGRIGARTGKGPGGERERLPDHRPPLGQAPEGQAIQRGRAREEDREAEASGEAAKGAYAQAQARASAHRTRNGPRWPGSHGEEARHA